VTIPSIEDIYLAVGSRVLIDLDLFVCGVADCGWPSFVITCVPIRQIFNVLDRER